VVTTYFDLEGLGKRGKNYTDELSKIGAIASYDKIYGRLVRLLLASNVSCLFLQNQPDR
jgi:hypothetical protein